MALEKTTFAAVSPRSDSTIMLANTDEAYSDFVTDMNHIKYVNIYHEHNLNSSRLIEI